jgi:hypothetical protein
LTAPVTCTFFTLFLADPCGSGPPHSAEFQACPPVDRHVHFKRYSTESILFDYASTGGYDVLGTMGLIMVPARHLSICTLTFAALNISCPSSIGSSRILARYNSATAVCRQLYITQTCMGGERIYIAFPHAFRSSLKQMRSRTYIFPNIWNLMDLPRPLCHQRAAPSNVARVTIFAVNHPRGSHLASTDIKFVKITRLSCAVSGTFALPFLGDQSDASVGC